MSRVEEPTHKFLPLALACKKEQGRNPSTHKIETISYPSRNSNRVDLCQPIYYTFEKIYLDDSNSNKLAKAGIKLPSACGNENDEKWKLYQINFTDECEKALLESFTDAELLEFCKYNDDINVGECRVSVSEAQPQADWIRTSIRHRHRPSEWCINDRRSELAKSKCRDIYNKMVEKDGDVEKETLTFDSPKRRGNDELAGVLHGTKPVGFLSDDSTGMHIHHYHGDVNKTVHHIGP